MLLYFSVLLALRLPRLGKRELILVFFVRLFDLRLFGFVCFLLFLVSGKGSYLFYQLCLPLCSLCGGLIVFVCVSLWCWGLEVDLSLSVPEFTYLPYSVWEAVIHSCPSDKIFKTSI